MNIVKKLVAASSLLMTLSLPAWASVTVNSPANGSQVTSPFTLSAIATICSLQPVAAIGYSLDGSSDTTIVNGTTVGASVAASAGGHILHAMAWGLEGSFCVTDVAFTVTSGGSTSGPYIPPNAIIVSAIQTQPNWLAKHDPATKGSSKGTMTLVTDPSLSGNAAQFDTSFKNWGGEIYSKSYDKDPDTQNFVYDAHVWIKEGSKVGNLEMDNNQVVANGHTIIYAFQCDGDHGSWDYSANVGTPKHSKVQWMHSNQPCNPANWTTNTWHHIQISYSRDDNGNVTYDSVWFDGVEAPINETVNSDFALGWSAGDLMINFQVDGAGSKGSSTLYLDNMTVSRW